MGQDSFDILVKLFSYLMALFHQQLCKYLLLSYSFFDIFERNATEMETWKGSSGEGAASKRLKRAIEADFTSQARKSTWHDPGPFQTFADHCLIVWFFAYMYMQYVNSKFLTLPTFIYLYKYLSAVNPWWSLWMWTLMIDTCIVLCDVFEWVCPIWYGIPYFLYATANSRQIKYIKLHVVVFLCVNYTKSIVLCTQVQAGNNWNSHLS